MKLTWSLEGSCHAWVGFSANKAGNTLNIILKNRFHRLTGYRMETLKWFRHEKWPVNVSCINGSTIDTHQNDRFWRILVLTSHILETSWNTVSCLNSIGFFAADMSCRLAIETVARAHRVWSRQNTICMDKHTCHMYPFNWTLSGEITPQQSTASSCEFCTWGVD